MFKAIQFDSEDDDDGQSYYSSSAASGSKQNQQQQQEVEEVHDDGPSFVLQYSTVDGKRLRRDPLVTKYARKSYELSFTASDDSASSRCCLLLLLLGMKLFLFTILFFPCIWSILNVTLFLPGAPLLGSSSAMMIPFPESCEYRRSISETEFTVDQTLLKSSSSNKLPLATASAKIPLSRCIACNGDLAALPASSPDLALTASSNPVFIGLAIAFNSILALVAVIAYHRLELRRRVCAHFLSFGVMLRNRNSAKRRTGVIVFVVLFLITLLATCAPRWSVTLDSRRGAVDLKLTTDVRLALTTGGGTVMSNALALDLLFGNQQSGEATGLAQQLGVSVDTLRSCIGYSGVANSAASSAGAGGNATVRVRLSALVGFLSPSSLDTISSVAVRRPYSFFDFFQDLFSAALPFVPLLILLHKRITGARLPAANFIQLAMERTRFNAISDLFAHVRWQADLDSALKAIDLYARAHDRTDVDEAGEEEAEEAEFEAALLLNQTTMASFSDGNQLREKSPPRPKLERDSCVARMARDGFVLSWFFACTWRSGFFRCASGRTGSAGGKSGRWTNKAHPHELLMGTRWGFDEESTNAVAGVLLEHRKMRRVEWTAAAAAAASSGDATLGTGFSFDGDDSAERRHTSFLNAQNLAAAAAASAAEEQEMQQQNSSSREQSSGEEQQQQNQLFSISPSAAAAASENVTKPSAASWDDIPL